MTQNFSPTSITSPFTGFNLSPTINQTGGANGITRGLYINPTLTSAADFRAIEVTAGKVIVPNGTASNEAVNKGQLDSSNYWTKTGSNIYNNITGGVTYFGENTSSAYYDKASSSILGAWTNGSFTNSSIGIRQSGGSTDGIAMYLNSLEAYLTAGTTRNLNLNTLNPTGTINFKINNANKLILNNNGTLNYSADYSSLYVDRSLVDKAYVDAKRIQRLAQYTVATLPTGAQGDTAYVTDAMSPTYLGTVMGGGAVICKVFYNGTNWIT